MSYVKDLMAVAAKWTKINASASGMIKIPRIEISRQATDRSYIDRYERIAAEMKDPAKAAVLRDQIQHLRKLHSEIDVSAKEVRQAEDQAEYHVNQVDATAQHKYVVDDIALNNVLHGRWCLAWAYAGHNVFELSNDFVAAMLLTDPREIRFDELRAPFPGVLVTIPDRFVVGVEGGFYTKIHLSYVDGSWGLYATDGVRVLDTHVAEGETLSWDLFEDLRTEAGVIEDADATAIRSIRQIAFGMLAYVTCVDRAIEERPGAVSKKRVADDELQQHPRVHDVGRSVKIDPILVKHARAGAREVALQVKHRFIVRGHYRNQAHGPARRDRKTIWIEPHWKGPEEGAAIVHTYDPTVPT